VDADGGEFGFGWLRPHSSQTRYSLRRDCEVHAGADQDFFEAADEFDHAQGFAFALRGGMGAQVENWIANDLAGAVESNVPAAVAFEDFDAALGK
jgi:hypothetical protein